MLTSTRKEQFFTSCSHKSLYNHFFVYAWELALLRYTGVVLALPCIDPLKFSSSLVYYYSEYERKSISTERYTVLAQKWEY